MSAEFARAVRAWWEEHPDAPEGVEFYCWLWVGQNCFDWRIPKPFDCALICNYTDPPPKPLIEEWRVTRDVQVSPKAWLGCNREARTCVLFFGRGGPPLERESRPEVVSDAGMHALADTGDEMRAKEASARLREMLDRFGLSEGEEWKRSDGDATGET